MSYDARHQHHATARDHHLAQLAPFGRIRSKMQPPGVIVGYIDGLLTCISSTVIRTFWKSYCPRPLRQSYRCTPPHSSTSRLPHYLRLHSNHMHYIKPVALVALAAIGVSALPLGSRGLVTADTIPRSVNDLVNRNYALDVPNDKKYHGRQILSSRAADASSLSPTSLRVSSPVSKNGKRAHHDDDPVIDIGNLGLPHVQAGASVPDVAWMGHSHLETDYRYVREFYV